MKKTLVPRKSSDLKDGSSHSNGSRIRPRKHPPRSASSTGSATGSMSSRTLNIRRQKSDVPLAGTAFEPKSNQVSLRDMMKFNSEDSESANSDTEDRTVPYQIRSTKDQAVDDSSDVSSLSTSLTTKWRQQHETRKRLANKNGKKLQSDNETSEPPPKHGASFISSKSTNDINAKERPTTGNRKLPTKLKFHAGKKPNQGPLRMKSGEITKPVEAKEITKREVERGNLRRQMSSDRRDAVKDHLKSFLADDDLPTKAARRRLKQSSSETS